MHIQILIGKMYLVISVAVMWWSCVSFWVGRLCSYAQIWLSCLSNLVIPILTLALVSFYCSWCRWKGILWWPSIKERVWSDSGLSLLVWDNASRYTGYGGEFNDTRLCMPTNFTFWYQHGRKILTRFNNNLVKALDTTYPNVKWASVFGTHTHIHSVSRVQLFLI